MIAVGVGSGINNNELMEIADGKRENVVHVDKFDELFKNENNVLFASCEPGKSAIRDFVWPGNEFLQHVPNCYGGICVSTHQTLISVT